MGIIYWSFGIRYDDVSDQVLEYSESWVHARVTSQKLRLIRNGSLLGTWDFLKERDGENWRLLGWLLHTHSARHEFAIVYMKLNDVTTLIPEDVVYVSEGKRTQGRHTGGILVTYILLIRPLHRQHTISVLAWVNMFRVTIRWQGVFDWLQYRVVVNLLLSVLSRRTKYTFVAIPFVFINYMLITQ